MADMMGQGPYQHMTVSRFLKSKYSGLFEDYFKFAFVRNPYDRLYSAFLQDKFASEHYGDWVPVKGPIFDLIGHDFNRYVTGYVDPVKIVNDWDWIAFCPMREFCCLFDRMCMDFIGHIESLDEDLQKLSDLINTKIVLAESANLRFVSPTIPKYLDRFERSTIGKINEIYKDDFEFFHYEMLNPNDFPISLP